MSTIVRCPECERKLKVAPASFGKSVKCTCGTIFKAPAEPGAPAGPAADLVIVVCESCGTQLKVPPSARGRKMRCSKCATIFVVGAEPTAPALIDENLPPPPARARVRSKPAVDEEPEAMAPKAVPAPVSRIPGRLLTAVVAALVVAYLGVLLPLYLGYLDWVPYAQPASAPAIRGNPAFRNAPEPNRGARQLP